MSKRRSAVFARYCHARGPLRGLTNEVGIKSTDTRSPSAKLSRPANPKAKKQISSKDTIQKELAKKRKAVRKLSTGQIVRGKVSYITHYGAFVDLGRVEGLLHISEMSWSFVECPSQVVKVGQRLKVMVIMADPFDAKVALSLKRLTGGN